MARVICTLPNASTLINGVVFERDGDRMKSEEVGDDVAARFAEIPGYALDDGVVEAKGRKPKA